MTPRNENFERDLRCLDLADNRWSNAEDRARCKTAIERLLQQI